MASSTDYSGRSVDLFIFQNAQPTGEAQIDPSFGEGGGRVTSGIQKLAQRWTFLMLTELESITYAPLIGTNLVLRVAQGGVRDEEEAMSLVRASMKRVQNIINNPNDPEDERLSSAEINSATIERAKSLLKIAVSLVSETGGETTILLPVTVAIQ